jgi:hypothetical protein
MKNRTRQSDQPTLFRRLTQLWSGQAGHSAQRLLESVLPVASLYGMDTAHIDPEWFREQRTR